MKWIRPRLRSDVTRQRMKLAWYAWGYSGALTISALPFRARLRLLHRFLRVDWNVPHAHTPDEIAVICRALAQRPARPGEVVVEAGCWRGGSSAKLSLICELLGYELRIFDSFEGVEPTVRTDGEYDFSHEYAAAESEVRRNIGAYGRLPVCTISPGWFKDTLARQPVTAPVRLAFIDCDLAKGTMEVLEGVMPSLSDDGVIVSQDGHIPSVQQVLRDPATWMRFGRSMPAVVPRGRRLVSIHF